MRCDFNEKGYQWWEFRYKTILLPGGGYKSFQNWLTVFYMTHQMLIPEQLEFIKELDAVQVEVMVDKGRLTQVITNFLNNASKFTKTGYIKLGYRYLSESDRVAIYVEGTGRGIELSEQKMIFSRFYKQDEFSQRSRFGTFYLSGDCRKSAGQNRTVVGTGERKQVYGGAAGGKKATSYK